MDGLDLLRLAAASTHGHVPAGAMPDDALRLALEYPTHPDIDLERSRIVGLLDSDAFSLRPMETEAQADLARFLVLQIPLLALKLSANARYEMANALVDRLGLVSCEPDLGLRIYAEPDARALEPTLPESVIIDLWCSSDAVPPSDKRWALDAIRAPGAWGVSPAMGKGVVIGQPDTGVATHPEIEMGALALEKAANLIEGSTDPIDPLSAEMANPGHGTATASVVISRVAGQIAGAAPGARVAPIRCINDVKIFNAAPVAAAVAHARRSGCDVVSMSLGGFFSSALATAIRDAVSSGIIVVAAAGNCVGFVVYPASDDNVIACAGVDEHDRPWKGTSAGSAVDIAAPGENVYVARRTPTDEGRPEVSGGQGTSFAAALTAGAAALWLGHHGPAAVRAEAGRRGVTVQALFRSALRRTARTPGAWNSNLHGAGILDMEALLRLKLSEIPAPSPAVEAGDGAIAKIGRLARQRQVVDGFDWARHGAEATFLAARAQMISSRSRAGMETVGSGVLRPSTEVKATAPRVLRQLLGESEDDALRPATVVMRSTTSNARLLKLAGIKANDVGLESTAAVTVETAQKRIAGFHGATLIAKMEKAFADIPIDDAAVVQERARTIEAVKSGLNKLGAYGVAASLSVHERIGVEALVEIHGRPALRVRDDGVDPEDPLAGDWTGALLPAAHLLKPVLQAVGRVNLDGVHVGTGFVVAPGRIMTNRHVLEAIGEEFLVAGGGSRWVFSGEATINFAEKGKGAETTFRILSVIAAGPDRIDETVNFAHLDMAVLEVESTNALGRSLPRKIGLVTDPSLIELGSQFILVGYPARPGTNSLRDPETGKIRNDVASRLGQIFGLDYSVKYLSPGEIDAPVGGLAGDAKRWVFTHDATTLGGNSGSCVIYLGQPFGVVGLHFGGGTLRANFAHGLVAVRNAGILAAAGLDGTTWI